MSVRQSRRRPSPNGWTLTWAGWPVASATCTRTCATAACWSASWRSSRGNSWSVWKHMHTRAHAHAHTQPDLSVTHSHTLQGREKSCASLLLSVCSTSPLSRAHIKMKRRGFTKHNNALHTLWKQSSTRRDDNLPPLRSSLARLLKKNMHLQKYTPAAGPATVSDWLYNYSISVKWCANIRLLSIYTHLWLLLNDFVTGKCFSYEFKSSIFFFFLLPSLATAHQRPHAYSLPGECGQGPAVSQGAESAPGKHGLAWHCGRESPPHSGPHLDHHPSLPGGVDEEPRAALLIYFRSAFVIVPMELITAYVWSKNELKCKKCTGVSDEVNPVLYSPKILQTLLKK